MTAGSLRFIDRFEHTYSQSGRFKWSDIQLEPESQEYEACRFVLNGKSIIFRKAKVTPTKIGQFVTVWKRPLMDDDIMPFDRSDDLDFIIIHCDNMGVDGDLVCGQFVFPKDVLVKHNVMSKDSLGGKRGFRVYPDWVTPIAKQAIKTQNWQLEYFIDCAFDPVKGYVFSNSDQFMILLGNKA